MTPFLIALSALLLISLITNVLLSVAIRKERKKPTPTADARALLHNLTEGGAVVRVTVLDPEALLLRRPGQ